MTQRQRRKDGRRVQVGGDCADGYGAVGDAFVANFGSGLEAGAAVTVFKDGKKVVDIWGGVADSATGRRWDEDTRAVAFSVSKAVINVCLHRYVESGELDLDAAVSTYWPEFGAAGKESVTVRQLLAHRAGLSVVDRAFTIEELGAWTPIVDALAHQKPMWPPGTAHAYHTITFGWLAGELLRRLSGLTPGSYLRERVNPLLGTRMSIGTGVEELANIAVLEAATSSPEMEAVTRRLRTAVAADPALGWFMTVGGALPLIGVFDEFSYNSPEVLAIEAPAVNAVVSARDVATLLAATISDLAGGPWFSDRTLNEVTAVQSEGAQRGGDDPHQPRWSSGFMLESKPRWLMLGPESWGHDGAGGELAFADKAHGISFAYINNRMGVPDDPRANNLVNSLRRSLGLPSGPIRSSRGGIRRASRIRPS